MKKMQTDGARFELCAFYIHDHVYGVDIQRVREINKNLVYTKAPGAPEFVMGVMNLRGRIVTVIDLRVKLGLPPAQISKESRILIVDSENEYVGLLIDKIGDVVSASGDDVEPPPANLEPPEGAMTAGVLKSPGRLINILDIDAVLE